MAGMILPRGGQGRGLRKAGRDEARWRTTNHGGYGPPYRRAFSPSTRTAGPSDADYTADARSRKNAGLLGSVFEIVSSVTGSRGIPEGWRYAVAGGGMMSTGAITLYKPGRDDVCSPQSHVGLLQDVPRQLSSATTVSKRSSVRKRCGHVVTIEVRTSHYASVPRWYVCTGALLIDDWSCQGRIIRAAEHEIT